MHGFFHKHTAMRRKLQVWSKERNTRVKFRIKHPQRFFAGFGVALFIMILIRNLWIGDDAFITLRVADNWVNGYGLTWNPSERVQAFTHPLWLFILALFYSIKADPYFTFYTSAFIISTITVIFLLFHFSPSFQVTLLGSWLIVSSLAFVDYSSSGLENPLSHLLLLAFIYVDLDKSFKSRFWRLFWMSLIAGLAALNRLDTILFFLPLLIYEWYQLRRNWFKASVIVFVGFLPLLCWEVFSLIYYGFLFPNTNPAKLNTTVPIFVFIQHGISYIINSLNWDPVTLITFSIAAFITIAERDKQKILLLSGGTLYLIYVIWIGGDFMTGRFFSILFLLSVVLLFKSNLQQHLNLDNAFSLGLTFLLVFMIGLSSMAPPWMIQADDKLTVTQNGIANEKLFFYSRSGWLSQKGQFTPPDFGGPEGLQARQTGKSPIFDSSIGAFGYYAGPDIYIIDSAALTDALLARIPYVEFYRPGHYVRQLPQGYVETFENGFENKIKNPYLKAYYDKLSVITRGDLFNYERWELIWEFNTGRYDYLMEKFINSADWITEIARIPIT